MITRSRATARSLTAAIALSLLCTACTPTASHRSVVVLGIDGMDPQLVQRFVDRGVMPHFAALMKQGSFSPLETSIPPQSPVAWSCFITGMDPGGHGIFDFIHRDTSTYLPVFSTALVSEPSRSVTIGDWVIPLSPGKTQLLRKGEAFWQVLDRHRVPYQILRVPANFPPAPSRGRTLSGMGTPDLLGSYGTFSLYTDDPSLDSASVTGGQVFKVAIANGQVRADLLGPENTLRRQRPRLREPLVVHVDPARSAVRVDLGGEAFVLEVGQWSPWVPVRFDLAGPFKRLHGICRFYLSSVRPFRLYVSPLNIDPAHPALPISTPGGYARALSERIGPFYTQGMPEDTKALEHGALDDSAYVAQSDTVLAEQWRMLDAVLRDYREGFLFFYVSTIDQSSHMMWRYLDSGRRDSSGTPPFADRLERLYAEMDRMLALVIQRMPHDATLIVMSDHGFAPYRKQFHLNTWLYREGYLSLTGTGDLKRATLFDHAAWHRTRAYAIGLNGLYLNVAGRERKGIVRRGPEYDALLDELSAKLTALRDPETGAQIITRVDRARDVYHGPEAGRAPDLIVGYNRGYRGADESALGSFAADWLTPNLDKWSGDHCIDHRLVPGVLFSNRKLRGSDPTLLDLPVTILGLYGIARPPQMLGRPLIAP